MRGVEGDRVPFEVVPGVTSASGAATLAGIPLTHRGIASAFLVVSGHDVERFAAAVQSVAPQGPTIVVLRRERTSAHPFRSRAIWEEASASVSC